MSEQKTTALVTGASSGLGAEYCRQLAARCDIIIAVARREEPLLALARELQGQVELHAIAADLGSEEGITRTVEALRQKGPVDYLVNNAGFGTLGHFDAVPIDRQQDMLNLHISATLRLCGAAIPFMRQRGGGAIINVSSVGAFMPGRGIAVYGATKAFLNFYSLSLQKELKDSGIRVQALCPGYTRTGFQSTPDLAGFDTASVPDEYWMEPDEVVRQSLAALEGGEVVVVTGDLNRQLARGGLEGQLSALQ